MIHNNLFITDSSEAHAEALIPFWQILKDNNFHFHYCGQNLELGAFFDSQKNDILNFHWPAYPTNILGQLFFWFAFPFYFIKIILKIHDRKPAYVISTGLSDTLLMAFLNKVIDYKHYWLLMPEIQNQAYKLTLARKLINKTFIFVFSTTCQARLEQLNFKNQISIMLPSIADEKIKHQENIFSTLAQKEYPRRKFFTIGTFTELTTDSHLETLLKAAKEIREVIPNLQIIIVGDGPEKKNLVWLSKTLGIESTVWFVGSTEKTFKWLENLDLYIYTKSYISLKEQLFALEIMSRKIPIIADIDIGLDDIIFAGKTGQLVKFKDTNNLSQTIIDIEQDIKIRTQMGEESKKRVLALFSPQKALDQFVKVL